MNGPADQEDQPPEQPALSATQRTPPTQDAAKPSLDELVDGARELYAGTTSQLRDIGELAFMELELAIRSLQWSIWTLFMFGTCSVMACAFMMGAVVLALLETSVSPPAIMLACGVFCLLASLFLFLGLRTLTKRMTFRSLRGHLTRPPPGTHSENKAHVGS